MKQRLLVTAAFSISSILLIACSNEPTVQQPQIVISQNPGATEPVALPEHQTGLNLQAVGELVRQSPNDPKELERMVNDPDRGVNNLDLDQNGQVDYINIQEVLDSNGISFKFYDTAVNPPREVVKVSVAGTQPGYAQVNLTGDPNLYGPNYRVSYEDRLANMALMYYLLTPHSVYYASPYHYGYYPGYYRPAPVVPYGAYSNRVRTVTRTTTVQRVSPPQAPRTESRSQAQVTPVAPVAPRNLNTTGTSQRSFEVRDTAKPIASGGFGKPATTSQPSAPPRASAPPLPVRSAPVSRPSPPSAPRSFGSSGSRRR